ncbi:hypothetical protein LguiA_012209 [Lonicera macranthoides]
MKKSQFHYMNVLVVRATKLKRACFVIESDPHPRRNLDSSTLDILRTLVAAIVAVEIFPERSFAIQLWGVQPLNAWYTVEKPKVINLALAFPCGGYIIKEEKVLE